MQPGGGEGGLTCPDYLSLRDCKWTGWILVCSSSSPLMHSVSTLNAPTLCLLYARTRCPKAASSKNEQTKRRTPASLPQPTFHLSSAVAVVRWPLPLTDTCSQRDLAPCERRPGCELSYCGVNVLLSKHRLTNNPPERQFPCADSKKIPDGKDPEKSVLGHEPGTGVLGPGKMAQPKDVQ